ncbi:dromaiocalcin-1-like [Haliotis cracherodii]|uniref:dromaiocalcin-1-like n=1 Tax=Haliotis cracherodii TaxID=6455 RepID=UPI0039ED7532
MGSPLALTLVYTKLFLTTPVPGTTASLTQCVSSCYISPSCASFFYNYDDSVCYHSYFLYSLDKYEDMLSTSAADIKYFEWTPASCDASHGWRYHKATQLCFKYHTHGQVFSDAEETCQSENSTLLRVDSPDRQHFIHHFANIHGKHIMTGGRKVNETWYWNNGTPLGYEAWEDDEPKDGKDCMLVDKDEESWKSEKCDSSEDYMCEKAISVGGECS